MDTQQIISITFLATLFLLLFISCAIVLRSYVLRRRFQRQLDEAMAAGILLTPRTPGSRKRRFGTKPKFHDIWLVRGGDTWNQMMVRRTPRCLPITYRFADSSLFTARLSTANPGQAPIQGRSSWIKTLKHRDERPSAITISSPISATRNTQATSQTAIPFHWLA